MDEGVKQCELVHKAICAALTGSILWVNEKTRRRVQSDAALQGLTPEGIIDLLISCVRDDGGQIKHKREDREHWKNVQDYIFWVLIPVQGLPRDLFVELGLKEPCDEEYPELWVLNAHLTSFG